MIDTGCYKPGDPLTPEQIHMLEQEAEEVAGHVEAHRVVYEKLVSEGAFTGNEEVDQRREAENQPEHLGAIREEDEDGGGATQPVAASGTSVAGDGAPDAEMQTDLGNDDLPDFSSAPMDE